MGSAQDMDEFRHHLEALAATAPPAHIPAPTRERPR
jgi:hypothetical protein